MDIRRIFVAVIILLIILIGVSLGAGEEIQTQGPKAFASSSIVAVHTFQAGTHRYRGIIDLPSPCFKLQTDIQSKSTNEDKVTLAFTATESKKRGQCISVVDPRPFAVDFESSDDIEVTSKVNGTSVPMQIISTTSPQFQPDLFPLNSRLPTTTNERTN
jgi:hypothetical protein